MGCRTLRTFELRWLGDRPVRSTTHVCLYTRYPSSSDRLTLTCSKASITCARHTSISARFQFDSLFASISHSRSPMMGWLYASYPYTAAGQMLWNSSSMPPSLRSKMESACTVVRQARMRWMQSHVRVTRFLPSLRKARMHRTMTVSFLATSYHRSSPTPARTSEATPMSAADSGSASPNGPVSSAVYAVRAAVHCPVGRASTSAFFFPPGRKG